MSAPGIARAATRLSYPSDQSYLNPRGVAVRAQRGDLARIDSPFDLPPETQSAGTVTSLNR
jgi:hypothetical protein